MTDQFQIDWNKVPPAHPICEAQVAVPTLRLQERGLDYPDRPPEFEGQEEIVVQWFGEDREGRLKDLQFAFPIMTSSDDVHWFGHPEWFRVVMLGPLKLWSNPQALAQFLKEGRSEDEIVLFVVTSHIGLDDGHGGLKPSALLVGVVQLADPMYGVVSPRVYTNWEISKEEIAKLARVTQRR